MYLTRSLEKIVSTASEFFPVVLVTGARQVGKTTLLRQMMERAGVQDYVSLDDPMRRELAASDPGLFMQNLKLPVLIDEIQYAIGKGVLTPNFEQEFLKLKEFLL